MVVAAGDPGGEGKQIEVTIRAQLHNHGGDPRFEALSERLERIRHEYEQGVLTGLEYLKQVLGIATDVVRTEQGDQGQTRRRRATGPDPGL